MNKIFLLVFLPILSFGQLQLNHKGLIFSETSKDFIVKEYPGQSAETLFKKLNAFFISSANNEFEVQNKIDNELLSITSTAKSAVFTRQLGLRMAYDLTYTWNFEFKDGRIKINVPRVNRMHYLDKVNKKDMYLFISKEVQNEKPTAQLCVPCTKYIFGENDKPKLDNAKESLEEFFNKKLDQVLKMEFASEEW